MSGKRRLFKSLQERLDEQRIKRQQEQLVKRGEITRYESDAENGLSDEQAAEHYNAGWYKILLLPIHLHILTLFLWCWEYYLS